MDTKREELKERERIEELVAQARKIEVVAIGTPYAAIRIESLPRLYGAWDNDGEAVLVPLTRLAMVRRLAERHGKQIALKSRRMDAVVEEARRLSRQRMEW